MFPNTTSTTGGTTSTAQVYLNWTRAAHEHWRSQTFTKGGRPPVSRAPRPCQFALPPTQAQAAQGHPVTGGGVSLPPSQSASDCATALSRRRGRAREPSTAHLPNLSIRFVPFNIEYWRFLWKSDRHFMATFFCPSGLKTFG